MVRKAVSVALRIFRLRLRTILSAAVTCLLFLTAILAAQNNAAPKPDENVFHERDATELLNQISEALVSHNQKKMLGAFDIAKMTDGPLFQQQITAFFGQTGVIRVHFNLAQAAMEDGKGAATVDMEMEADLRDDGRPPVRKQAQLRFVAEKSPDGWRFTDVRPRTFFSTSQP
jgi:hypothetical protein